MKATNFLWLAIVLFVLVLPISSYISTRILIILLILSIVFGERKFNLLDLLESSWDILLYLVIISIGIIYSSDKVTGLRVLETSFSLLALPIICARMPDFSRERLNRIFLFFSSGIFIAGFICLAYAVFTYLNNDHNSQVFFFYDFTEIISSHPTYFAYYLIFSITFGLYALNYEKVQLPIVFVVIFVLFYFLILLLTGGQTAFIALLFVFSFFILKFLLGQRERIQKITFALVGFMLVSIFILNSGGQPERKQILNDSWDRFELWRSGISANRDFMWGVGTGDYKSALNDYFRRNNQESFAQESLNSHNQIIQIFFSNGVLGLISILIMMLRPLYLAFKHDDQMGILMIFPFLIYGITEVFLGRHQGVVFFALLHQVFISFYMYSRTRQTRPA